MPNIAIDTRWKKRVLAGRKAVDQYRADHSQLRAFNLGKGIHNAHTPLLNTMLKEFKKQDFNSIQEFFDASEELNVQELGFSSSEDFKSKATRADIEALNRRSPSTDIQRHSR